MVLYILTSVRSFDVSVSREPQVVGATPTGGSILQKYLINSNNQQIMKILIPIIFFTIFIIGCGNQTEIIEIEKNKKLINEVFNMKLTSPAFENNGKIPAEYTCDGEDVNPELIIEDVPENSKSLALIMDDSDVPKHIRPDGLWIHWVVWNIPPETKTIAKSNG